MPALFDENNVSDIAQRFRRSVLLALLVFTALFGASFAVLNYLHSNYGLMIGELVMGSFALLLLPVIRRTRQLMHWSFLYLLLFNSTMMYALTTPMSAPSVFAWVLLIPVICHLLLGRLVGGSLAIAFLGIAFAVYFMRYGADVVHGNGRALANIAGTAICTFCFAHIYETSRAKAEHALQQQARTDPLTGLGNRAALFDRFRIENARFNRTRRRFALLMIDIDFFKTINDRFGHEIGDQALCWLADTLKDEVRDDDHAFRFGGEEFCVLLADADADAARASAERLRQRVEHDSFETDDHAIDMTASIGLAEIETHGNTLQGLLNVADKRLYEAKVNGRNVVIG